MSIVWRVSRELVCRRVVGEPRSIRRLRNRKRKIVAFSVREEGKQRIVVNNRRGNGNVWHGYKRSRELRGKVLLHLNVKLVDELRIDDVLVPVGDLYMEGSDVRVSWKP